jgi:hypothetical protein
MSKARSFQSKRNGTALSSVKVVLLSMREYMRLLLKLSVLMTYVGLSARRKH